MVVWLGKRGRVCQKSSGFKNWQECLWNNILQSATLHHILFLCAFFEEGPAPSSLCATVSRLSVLCRLGSDFNVLLDAELGQGLFDAQGRQPGSSVSIPTLPHNLAHNPQGLERQEDKSKDRELTIQYKLRR